MSLFYISIVYGLIAKRGLENIDQLAFCGLPDFQIR